MQQQSSIHDILKQFWGYDTFRPLQEEIIASVLEGRDTLGLMPTGGGKSITFQVPVMACEGICLVITPLISLMKDQVDNLRDRGIKASCLFSGMTHREIVVTLENCIFGNYKFLYVSPERLGTELFQSKLKALNVSLIVVDEAHCISQWGYDFRPSYLQIADIRTLLPQTPLLALTATATPEVVEDIQTKLLFKNGRVFQKSFHRPNLSYVVRKGENKIQLLTGILGKVSGSAIVYVRSRKKTKEIAEELNRCGISADYYHAGLKSDDKDSRQEQWKNNDCRVIVATNAFGMGIDKPDVRLVVHLDLPNSPEEYYQEAGRAGRDEQQAYAVILYAQNDKTKLKKRISDLFPERDFIKRVYEALCCYFQVAAGAGIGSMHDFNIAPFCHNYKFPLLPTHHALKILEQAGYIEYAEDVDTRSRVMMTMQRDELYRLSGIDRKTDELLQCLLRSYTGLFADYVFIREEQLSKHSGLSAHDTYEQLLILNRLHILHYIPRKRTPLIIFTQNREELRYITISKTVYEDRKTRFEHRINSMLNYTSEDKTCRTRLLLEYFGEKMESDCCACDICRRTKKGPLDASLFRQIEQQVSILLSENNLDLETLAASISQPPEQLIEVLRFLCDQGQIRFQDGYYMNRTKKLNQ